MNPSSQNQQSTLTPASISTTLLGSYDVRRLNDGLRRLAYLGSAIKSVGKVVEVVQTLAGSDPCPRCRDLHAELANGYIQGGLNTALAELGGMVADVAENMESILADAEITFGEDMQ